jgi:hypothetical protein
MTTIQQALHIFRKDARHLRFELAATGVLLLILLFTSVQTWEGLQERGNVIPDSAGPLTMLLLTSWSLLIARVVQTEALPGDRHFWLTRPYNRASLVLSKAMFALAFVNLPLLIVHAALLWFDGLPVSSYLGGLLTNQVLLTVVLLLPVATVAALTRNLAQFVPVAIVVGMVLVAPVVDRRGYGDLEWIPSALGGLFTVAIAAFVLWRQYRTRRSLHTAALGAAATAVAIIVYSTFPQGAAFAVQSQLSKSPDGSFRLSLGQAPARSTEPGVPNRFRQLVALPMNVDGASPADLRIQSAEVTLKTLSGVRRRVHAQVEMANDQLRQVISLDRTFFDAAKDAPVQMEAVLYITQYGHAQTKDVPLDGTPVYIPGPGQCGVVASYSRRQFVCRSAFHNPQPFLSDDVEPRGYNNYDPLRDTWFTPRVRFLVAPISGRTYGFVDDTEHLAPAAPLGPASILVRDPIAYFRYVVSADNVRLGDYAIGAGGAGGQ